MAAKEVKNKGFVEVFVLLLIVVIILKIYIVYRAFSLAEETARKNAGLPHKDTATEFVERQMQESSSDLAEEAKPIDSKETHSQ